AVEIKGGYAHVAMLGKQGVVKNELVMVCGVDLRASGKEIILVGAEQKVEEK
ncbi:hypothetical protein P7K49_021099, partial [Saguinus oedipus]